MDHTLLYTRVSDHARQADNFSLSSQIDEMNIGITGMGWGIYDRYIETEGASQYSEGLDRTMLGKVRELARLGLIDALVVYSSDRFTRDMGDGVILRRELRRYNVRLFFFSPVFREVTSETEIINIFEDYQSAQYVEKLREASMRGTREKAKLGLFSGARCPYGYRTLGEKRDTRLEIVDEYAQVVQRIYQWFVNERLGTTTIAALLTKDVIPTPGDIRHYKTRTRSYGTWSQVTVHSILRDETYAGVWHAFRKQKVSKTKMIRRPREEWIAVPVPAIIDHSLWEAAQQRLEHRGDHFRNVKNDYLVSQRCTCTCGLSMQGSTKHVKGQKSHGYYRCCGRLTAQGRCGAPGFRVDTVDAVVWDFIIELTSNPHEIMHAYKRAQEQSDGQHGDAQRQLVSIDEHITEEEYKLSSVIEMRQGARLQIIKDQCDQQAEQIGMLIEQLRDRRTTYAMRLRKITLSDEDIALKMRSVEDIRDEIHHLNGSIDFPVRRALFEALDLRVTLRCDEEGDKWADIHWLFETKPVPISTDSATRIVAKEHHYLLMRSAPLFSLRQGAFFDAR